jgi:hypothetical protein
MHKTHVSRHSRISIRQMSCESILPRLTKTLPRDLPARHEHLVSGLLDKGYLFNMLTSNELVKVESRVGLIRILGPTMPKVAIKCLVTNAPHLVRRKKVTIFISSPKIPDVRLFTQVGHGNRGITIDEKISPRESHLLTLIYQYAITYSKGDMCPSLLHLGIKGERSSFVQDFAPLLQTFLRRRMRLLSLPPKKTSPSHMSLSLSLSLSYISFYTHKLLDVRGRLSLYLFIHISYANLGIGESSTPTKNPLTMLLFCRNTTDIHEFHL